jgi:DNA-binding MarR family transcriptional regulator
VRTRVQPLPPGRLAAELLAASAWFDAALRVRLAQRGWPELSPTRSRTFLALSRGPILISDLARELDVSRQAVHKLVDGLQRDGLVDRRPAERDRRAQLVVLTDRGLALARDAGGVLLDLEDELTSRIGAPHVGALRAALAHDRGPTPTGEGPPTGQA